MQELKFYKDGQEVVCKSVGESIRKGQILIAIGNFNEQFATHNVIPNTRTFKSGDVFLVKDLQKDFALLECTDGRELILPLQARQMASLPKDYPGKNTNYNWEFRYFFDIAEYLTWKAMSDSDHLHRKNRKIEQLEGHKQLLTDIIVKQGFRVVSDSQAKELGIA
jgi:hypothetical protein